MRVAVITFPGSNSDHDSYSAVKYCLQEEVEYVWHQETDLSGFDCVVLPGGFSYGDYLRGGAIARFSPIMTTVTKFVADGGFVLGICNGFQVLTESGLLPGALIRNRSLRFLGQWTYLRVENNKTPFTTHYTHHQVIKVPIAHGEGNFYVADDQLDEIESANRVVFRYCDREGVVSEATNPNGSRNSIAGIVNVGQNVLGMMPHPERVADSILGSGDGLILFESLREAISKRGSKTSGSNVTAA